MSVAIDTKTLSDVIVPFGHGASAERAPLLLLVRGCASSDKMTINHMGRTMARGITQRPFLYEAKGQQQIINRPNPTVQSCRSFLSPLTMAYGSDPFR